MLPHYGGPPGYFSIQQPGSLLSTPSYGLGVPTMVAMPAPLPQPSISMPQTQYITIPAVTAAMPSGAGHPFLVQNLDAGPCYVIAQQLGPLPQQQLGPQQPPMSASLARSSSEAVGSGGSGGSCPQPSDPLGASWSSQSGQSPSASTSSFQNALRGFQQQQQQQGGTPNHPTICNLIVNYIPVEVTEAEFTQLFAQFGELENASIITDRVTGYSKGYGFIRYKLASAAAEAMKQLDGFPIYNKRLRVGHAMRQRGGMVPVETTPMASTSSQHRAAGARIYLPSSTSTPPRDVPRFMGSATSVSSGEGAHARLPTHPDTTPPQPAGLQGSQPPILVAATVSSPLGQPGVEPMPPQAPPHVIQAGPALFGVVMTGDMAGWHKEAQTTMPTVPLTDHLLAGAIDNFPTQ